MGGLARPSLSSSLMISDLNIPNTFDIILILISLGWQLQREGTLTFASIKKNVDRIPSLLHVTTVEPPC